MTLYIIAYNLGGHQFHFWTRKANPNIVDENFMLQILWSTFFTDKDQAEKQRQEICKNIKSKRERDNYQIQKVELDIWGVDK